MSMFKLFTFAAALAVAAVVAMNYGDMKRYIKIERM